MSGQGYIESVEQLLDAGPERAFDRWELVSSGRQVAPEDFNWHGLAQSAALLARQADTSESKLAWARVAASIYEWLAARSDDAAESFTTSAMYVRANLINELGDAPGHPLLDVSRITRWFMDTLPMPLADAERLADEWQRRLGSGETGEMTGPEVENVRQLRRVKNRLNVIRHLLEGRRLAPDPELAVWLALRQRLP